MSSPGWNENAVHTCYGCKWYHNDKGEYGKPFSYKYCGQDHYECPYFCCTGESLGKKEVKYND